MTRQPAPTSTQAMSRRGLMGLVSAGAAGATIAAAGTMLSAPALAATSQDLVAADVNTVRVIGGPINGTTLALACDLADVLDSAGKLRVLPIVGKGSLQNVADLVGLHDIDVAIVQSDVLTYAQRNHIYPGLAQSIQYITKLYDGELHVLAHKDITSIQALAHHRVNCDVPGGGTSITAPLVLSSLGIEVEVTNYDQDMALEKLRSGDIAAMVWLVGKPGKLFSSVTAADNLHLLPIPMNSDLLVNYSPSQFSHATYPNLVPEGTSVDTLAVGYVMAAYGWRADKDKYRRLARFVDAFFDHFQDFTHAPRHPKWSEVNLAAEVPGWTRFPPAQEWLNQHSSAAAPKPASVDNMTDSEKEQMLRDLQAWHRAGAHK